MPIIDETRNDDDNIVVDDTPIAEYEKLIGVNILVIRIKGWGNLMIRC